MRVQDQAIDVLQVVAVRGQLLFQVCEQRGVFRRIVGADVIGLVNDAAAQQPRPDAVDDIPREPGVLRRNQPVGKNFARIAVVSMLAVNWIYLLSHRDRF